MRNMYYVDMHCHPALKPYSWSIKKSQNLRHGRNEKTSLWYNDPPKGLDKAINKFVTLTKFTQSDFRTLTKGNVKIISACLNPIERGLFTYRWPFKLIGFIVLKIVLEVGFAYILLSRKKKVSYFDSLQNEYNYFLEEEKLQNDNKVEYPHQFKLTRDFSQIDANLKETEIDIISVFFSIEGCHVFNNSGKKESFPEEVVMQNIQAVKDWEYRPLYVSISHHMNNDLCGHAKSLSPLLGKIINQEEGMGKGFSDLGEKVLHKLLEKDTGRIYIDIKHMSAESRIRYYEILDTDYKDEPIPVLASHGAVNGREAIDDKEIGKRGKGKGKFNNEDINFCDDEIIRMHCTGGFLGIQLDERRLCPQNQKRRKRRKRKRGERLRCHSFIVWNQIRHIAEVLDKKGLFGWDTATIGSDYDGIVDPPNGYWTSDDFGILEENLLFHATTYMNKSNDLKDPRNKSISPEEIIKRFMRDNALQFLKNFFTDDVRITKNQEKDTPCKEAGMNK